jgi:hypothetical protein
MSGAGGAGGERKGIPFCSSVSAIDVTECPSKKVVLENIVSTMDGVIDIPASEVA